jgi:cell filamentation protein
MVDKYGTGQDPYCYPGTYVLINKFNIQDQIILQEAEREITTVI